MSTGLSLIWSVACWRTWEIGRTHLKYVILLTSESSLYRGQNRSTLFPKLRPEIPIRDAYHQLYESSRKKDLPRRLGSPIRLALRLANLSAIFGITALLVGPLYFISRWKRTSSSWLGIKAENLAYLILLKALRRAGATFIKLGQWAATRPDVLPTALCNALGQLHSGAPHHSMAWTRYLIRRELGHELEELFSTFDAKPLGSGTIGQVHRATLRTGQYAGLTVAVKVTHPHITERIERDLQLLTIGVALLQPILPNCLKMGSGRGRSALGEEVAHFATMMRQQLDLRHEAYTLDRFARNFSTWSTVAVPIPIYPYVTPAILTESLVEGVPISSFLTSPWCKATDYSATEGLRLQKMEYQLKRDLAYTGLAALLQMLLWDNFVHADLHPGNILVRFIEKSTGRICWTGPPSSHLCEMLLASVKTFSWHRLTDKSYCKSDLIPQLVLLDTGLVTQLGRRDRHNFDDLFLALVLRGDGNLAGKLLIERGPDPQSVRNPAEFCQALDQLVRPIFRDALELRSFALGPTLVKLLELVRQHQVRLEAAYTNLIMSFLCMEGLGRALAPDLNILPMLARGALQYLVSSAAFRVHEYHEYYRDRYKP